MRCTNCGKPMPDKATFCPYCSARPGVDDGKKNSNLSPRQLTAVILMVAMLVVVVMAFFSNKSIKGNWKMDSAIIDGETVSVSSKSVKLPDDFSETTVISIKDDTLTVKDDGDILLSKDYRHSSGSIILLDKDGKEIEGSKTDVSWKGFKLVVEGGVLGESEVSFLLKRKLTISYMLKNLIFIAVFGILGITLAAVLLYKKPEETQKMEEDVTGKKDFGMDSDERARHFVPTNDENEYVTRGGDLSFGDTYGTTGSSMSAAGGRTSFSSAVSSGARTVSTGSSGRLKTSGTGSLSGTGSMSASGSMTRPGDMSGGGLHSGETESRLKGGTSFRSGTEAKTSEVSSMAKTAASKTKTHDDPAFKPGSDL